MRKEDTREVIIGSNFSWTEIKDCGNKYGQNIQDGIRHAISAMNKKGCMVTGAISNIDTWSFIHSINTILDKLLSMGDEEYWFNLAKEKVVAKYVKNPNEFGVARDGVDDKQVEFEKTFIFNMSNDDQTMINLAEEITTELFMDLESMAMKAVQESFDKSEININIEQMRQEAKEREKRDKETYPLTKHSDGKVTKANGDEVTPEDSLWFE